MGKGNGGYISKFIVTVRQIIKMFIIFLLDDRILQLCLGKSNECFLLKEWISNLTQLITSIGSFIFSSILSTFSMYSVLDMILVLAYMISLSSSGVVLLYCSFSSFSIYKFNFIGIHKKLLSFLCHLIAVFSFVRIYQSRRSVSPRSWTVNSFILRIWWRCSWSPRCRWSRFALWFAWRRCQLSSCFAGISRWPLPFPCCWGLSFGVFSSGFSMYPNLLP